MSISACLIVYNEEKNIARALNSVKDIAQEIILVHDGDCADRTLEIAKDFGAKIFIRPHYGFMEAHLPFCLNKAQGDWILRIDADEFLSDKLQNNIRQLAENNEVNGYEFVWPTWDGVKYSNSDWPVKIALFRKNKISFLAVPHYLVQVKGKIKKTKFILEHRPKYLNYSYKSLKNKWLKWARLQAEIYLRDYKEIESFNNYNNDWPRIIKLRIKYPLLISPLDFLFTFIKYCFINVYNGRLVALKAGFLSGLYKVIVDYNIAKSKKLNINKSKLRC